MDLAGIAALITALVTTVTAITGGLIALYKLAVESGKKEALTTQSQKTIKAKDAEIDELKAENQRLWALLDGFTVPPGRSS